MSYFPTGRSQPPGDGLRLEQHHLAGHGDVEGGGESREAFLLRPQALVQRGQLRGPGLYFK